MNRSQLESINSLETDTLNRFMSSVQGKLNLTCGRWCFSTALCCDTLLHCYSTLPVLWSTICLSAGDLHILHKRSGLDFRQTRDDRSYICGLFCIKTNGLMANPGLMSHRQRAMSVPSVYTAGTIQLWWAQEGVINQVTTRWNWRHTEWKST